MRRSGRFCLELPSCYVKGRQGSRRLSGTCYELYDMKNFKAVDSDYESNSHSSYQAQRHLFKNTASSISSWCGSFLCQVCRDPSSSICSQGRRAKCQPALMHSQRPWTDRQRSRRSHFLTWQVSWEFFEGEQTVTMTTLSPPDLPAPPWWKRSWRRWSGRTKHRWQLSLQSWWDKVISLSCCNWWALGWSNFTSLSAFSEG